MVGRPPPRPSPTNSVGEGGATHLAEAGSNSPLSPAQRGRGGPVGRQLDALRSAEKPRLRVADAPGCDTHDKRGGGHIVRRPARHPPNRRLLQAAADELGLLKVL